MTDSERDFGRVEAEVAALCRDVKRLQEQMAVGFEEIKALLDGPEGLFPRLRMCETAIAEGRGRRSIIWGVFGFVQALIVGALLWIAKNVKWNG